MRQGLDIADVEERTKIRAKYLRALENEDWGTLPGHTFVKTFLRTYAEQVGVDPHLLVEEYRMSHEAEEPDFQPLAGPPAAAGRESRRERRRSAPPGPPGRGVLLALAAVALVGFLLVLGLLGGDDSGDAGDDDRASTQETQTERQTPTNRRPRRSRAPVSGVVLRVTPSVPTYACIDTGDGTDVMFEGTLDAARTFRSPTRLRINLGKRSVELRLNGEAVAIEDSPEPLGMDVTEDGAEEIVEGTRPCA